MKILTLWTLLLMFAMCVLVLLNWSALTTPATLSLGVTTARAPLGLAVLAASSLLSASLLVFIVYQQAAALVGARRSARELEAQRRLAERAEESRISALREDVDKGLRALGEAAADRHREVQQLLAHLEEALVAKVSGAENGLAAHLAEVEDKIDHSIGGAAHPGDGR